MQTHRNHGARVALVCALALVLPAHVHAAGDVSRGQAKAGSCSGCHQIAGWRNAYPAYSVPKLGGQHADYIVAALKAYRSGERTHPTMSAITATLSDGDMQDLAAYFSGVGQRREAAP